MTGSTLPADWRVKLPAFEGPLDLLLHLVRINEVEIGDIPVARVCDQFQEYLDLMEELDLDIAAEYVYEAAYLIQLKSKMLLPVTADEDGDGEDPRQDLVERLLEYRKLKEAAQSLAEIHSVRRGVWVRPVEPLSSDDETVELGEVSLYDLLGALKTVLVRYDLEHPPAFHISGESFATRDQFERLLDALTGGRPVDLVDDLASRSCRAEAIAAFLAVLELSRLNLVRLHQTATGAVLMYRTNRQLEQHELEAITG
ncbi:MAG: segregation and condensation protein A [Thermoanaerobaculia bacterium]